MTRSWLAGAILAASLASAHAAAQQAEPPPEPPVVAGEAPVAAPEPFRFSAEFKLNFRSSKDLQTPIFTPFPEEDEYGPFTQRTVDPGSSFELSSLNLRGEGEITSGVWVRAEVHLLDLYNRNPTSSDDRIFLREAWVRFGGAIEPLRPASAHGAYVLLGMAPRFTKQLVRHLDSYGLWGTAVGRFEQPQLQVGAGLGRHGYVKAMVGSGNPLFLRDTNALAGDNGTPERAPGSPDRTYETGFPILYDAKPSDLSLGRVEWGLGLGARFERGESSALDVLGWGFGRRLSDSVRIRGSELLGDIELLRGEGFPLPFEGRRKREWGINLQGKAGGLRLFGQYVWQDIASLKRRGYELDLAWLQPLDGLFLIQQSPFLNWIQPTVRISSIDTLFSGPRQFPSLSVLWDWKKYDLGVRLGLVHGVDLTLEYSRHNAVVPRGTVHPDEFLTTLRVGF